MRKTFSYFIGIFLCCFLMSTSAQTETDSSSQPKLTTPTNEKKVDQPEENDNLESDQVTDSSTQPETPETSDELIIIEDEDDVLLIEDDDLLITDDSEESILIDEGLIPENQQPEKKDTDTTSIPKKKVEPAKVVDSPDTLAKDETEIGKDIEVSEQPDTQPVQELKPAKIEKTRSIDFAKNLKEYRSPKRAMFMSLLVPGLGQAYSKKYWKTALFGVIEVGLIGLSAKFTHDGNHEKGKARDFADVHFNLDSFFSFYENFMKYITKIDTNIGTPNGLNLAYVFPDSLHKLKTKYIPEQLVDHESDLRQDFDGLVGSDVGVQGWIDREPGFDSENGFHIGKGGHYFYKHFSKDTLWQILKYSLTDTNSTDGSYCYGYSPNQIRYNRMISESNRYHDLSRTMIILMIGNHLVSAIDAFITARAFNDQLLKKKSVWQHINLNHTLAMVNGDIQSHIGVRIRF